MHKGFSGGAMKFVDADSTMNSITEGAVATAEMTGRAKGTTSPSKWVVAEKKLGSSIKITFTECMVEVGDIDL